jgi:hypothetical protein
MFKNKLGLTMFPASGRVAGFDLRNNVSRRELTSVWMAAEPARRGARRPPLAYDARERDNRFKGTCRRRLVHDQ